MDGLQEEKVHLSRMLEDVKDHLRNSDEEKSYYQERFQELQLKLMESYNARETGIDRAVK
jgi:hypothetical protein